jgi:hypothetical protein
MQDGHLLPHQEEEKKVEGDQIDPDLDRFTQLGVSHNQK